MILAHKKIFHPIHFEMKCDEKDIHSNVIELRSFALKYFDKVTKVFRLYDKDCFPINDEDHLIEIKKANIEHKERERINLSQKSIVAFAFRMPNGKNGYIGFSTYEEDSESDYWVGAFDTMSKDRSSICVHSHVLCYMLLHQVSNLKIDIKHDSKIIHYEDGFELLSVLNGLFHQGRESACSCLEATT
jgi:hypothetical protein